MCDRWWKMGMMNGYKRTNWRPGLVLRSFPYYFPKWKVILATVDGLKNECGIWVTKHLFLTFHPLSGSSSGVCEKVVYWQWSVQRRKKKKKKPIKLSWSGILESATAFKNSLKMGCIDRLWHFSKPKPVNILCRINYSSKWFFSSLGQYINKPVYRGFQ